MNVADNERSGPEGQPIDIPILPLRNSVFFPGSIMPISVGRPKTLAMVKAVEESGEPIGIVAQKDGSIDDPGPDDLFAMGTTGRIVKALKAGDEGFHLVLQGLKRFRVLGLTQTTPYLRARVVEVKDINADPLKIEALVMNVKKTAREVVALMPEIPSGAAQFVEGIEDPGHLADLIAANMDVSVEEKMEVLNLVEVTARLEHVLELLHRKLEVLKLSNKIDSQVKGEMNKTQREYYLRQQLKAIKEELGEADGTESDLDELEQKLKQAKLPPEAEKVSRKELRRLRQMPSSSSEYTVGRTYLEWMADLPWSKNTTDTLDIANVRKVLEENHYGLEKVKKRIVEYLAVRKLKSDMKGPILCMVGPPGVGKTSLGHSIATSMGRNFQRISLGGVRDEAEIRGHRRTYVGALPGRIIQGLKKAGSNNPVFVLDEIDKLSYDFRGDPASALLEVLDPEQNNTFSDHYLEIPFDLSKVLFIATANQLEPVPPALKDRMEIIEIPGYTHEEKLHIARRHLIPKSLEAHGVGEKLIELQDSALAKLIVDYTREAGVRNLERSLNSVVRGVAVKVAEGMSSKTVVDADALEEYLGPEKFYNEMAERTEVPGVATGLAWTAAGGDILFVEATKMGGKGNLTLTGQLGAVMKESAQAAMSYLRSRAPEFGITDSVFEKHDLHVHVPAGGIPKDGPSAGITMIVSLTSLLTGINVRSDVAMTGEITLRGNVLPIGGVKEKVLAALRAGVKEVILPERNRKDLVEVPKEVQDQLKFHFVHRVDDALDIALTKPPERFPVPVSSLTNKEGTGEVKPS
ncbi:MAG: endopeptidase La [Deltaproteobacteria bacterium]|nr:endopeptidase La [Deltaproteobacteria bacterium]